MTPVRKLGCAQSISLLRATMQTIILIVVVVVVVVMIILIIVIRLRRDCPGIRLSLLRLLDSDFPANSLRA